MDLSGSIVKIFDEQSWDSGFKKREFVIKTGEQYPQDVIFQMVNDKCTMIDAFKVGQEIKVHFDVRGREYNDRYFTNLQAWKIDAVGSEAPAGSDAPPADTQEPISSGDESFDDLPF